MKMPEIIGKCFQLDENQMTVKDEDGDDIEIFFQYFDKDKIKKDLDQLKERFLNKMISFDYENGRKPVYLFEVPEKWTFPGFVFCRTFPDGLKRTLRSVGKLWDGTEYIFSVPES